ncbi:MAG: CtsR family transcriptional regulator [Clostridia bacterium]|nr:CtsR family transcriptional regulator [Clostridia bacterium]
MSMSNIIANMILEMLSDGGETEIQRNELAQTLGCVPSQINYVISSRFTPEQGYIVESRRGGGGYIRIARVKYDKSAMLMHVVNTIGNAIDEATCRAHIYNLNYQDILSADASKLMLAAIDDRCFREVPAELKDKVRAAIFKQMLLVNTK